VDDNLTPLVSGQPVQSKTGFLKKGGNVMANELVKFDRKTIEILDKAAELGVSASAIQSKFERTYTLASAVEQLRGQMTPALLKPLMSLQNTSLGFRTDKPAGYDELTIRDAIIEATLRGLHPCGNEFNIISGKCYITKEGFAHLLRNVSSLSYTIIPGVPHVKDNGAIIDMEIRYKFNGKEEKQVLPVCVRVNSGMGADAIIGKATRKARAWLHATVTGQEIGDGDVQEDATVIDIKAEKVESKATELFKDGAK
jgi:hypothetical protein